MSDDTPTGSPPPDPSSAVPSFQEFFTQADGNGELSPIEGDIFTFRIHLRRSNPAANKQQEITQLAHLQIIYQKPLRQARPQVTIDL